MRQLTDDHRPEDGDERTRVLAAGGWFSGDPPRVNGVLSPTRALGDFAFKPAVSCLADCRTWPRPVFVVIACDGIWDVMTNERAVAIASKAIRNKEDAARAVVRQAYALGSTDNMTAVVVHLAAGAAAAAE